MIRQGREDLWQGGGWRTSAGEREAGEPGKAAAGGAGSRTFVCRETGRNNWGARQITQCTIAE